MLHAIQCGRIRETPLAHAPVDHRLARFDTSGAEDPAVVIEAGLRAYRIDAAATGIEHGTQTVGSRLQRQMSRWKAGRTQQQIRRNLRSRAVIFGSQLYGISRDTTAHAISTRHIHALVALEGAAHAAQPVPERTGIDGIEHGGGLSHEGRRYTIGARPRQAA